MRWRNAVSAVSVLALMATGCGDDGDESGEATTTTVEQPTTTTTIVASTTSTVPPDSAYDVPLGWALEDSFDGVLDNPVAIDGGFAAVYSDDEHLVRELWTSVDGVEWAPAPDPPPGVVERLTAQGGDLFVESDAGVWALRPEDGWREVISLDGYNRGAAAVGPDRIVVFSQGATPSDPFGVVGVFDTSSLDPVAFDPLLPSNVEGAVGEGRVIALDVGFLAEWTEWFRLPRPPPDPDPGERVGHLMISGDGVTWAEHPTATTETVDVWSTSVANGPATHDGLSLVQTPDGLAVTDDGLEFEPTGVNPPRIGAPVATDAGFFGSHLVDVDDSIGHSTNGVEWRSVQPPPTWGRTEDGSPTDIEFYSGTFLTAGDDLVAFVHRGDIGGWGFLENPITEIWRATLPDVGDSAEDEAATAEPVDEFTRLSGMPWASPDDAHADPIAAVEAFMAFVVEDVYPDGVGEFGEVVIGEYAAGDQRSGEVEVTFAEEVSTGSGSMMPVTTVLVRQAGADDSWWVLGAVSDAVVIHEPAADAVIGSVFDLEYTNAVFSGGTGLQVHASGADAPQYVATQIAGGVLAWGEWATTIELATCEPVSDDTFIEVTTCDGPGPAGADGTLIIAHNYGITTVPIVFADT